MVGASPDLQIYRKNILLLGGEYLPGMDAFPFLRRVFPQIANFGRGPGPTVLKLRTPGLDLLYGPVICYEILDAEYVRGAWRQGSQIRPSTR